MRFKFKFRKNFILVSIAFLILTGLLITTIKCNYNYLADIFPVGSSVIVSPSQSSASDTAFVRGFISPTGLSVKSNLNTNDGNISMPFASDIGDSVGNELGSMFPEFVQVVCTPITELGKALEGWTASYSEPLNLSRTVDGIKCDETVSGRSYQSLEMRIKISIGSNSINRKLSFDSSKEEVSAQNANISESMVNGLSLTAELTLIFSWTKGQLPVISLSDADHWYINGSAEFSFVQNLTAKEDLSRYFEDVTDLYVKPGSTWTMETSGKIDMKVKVTFFNYVADLTDDSPYFRGHTEISNVKACENTCLITYTERQKLNATKEGTVVSGGISSSGDIISNVTHTETYSGKMTYSEEKKMFTWNDDLKIVKSDNRDWKHILESKSLDGYKKFADWIWEKKIVSNATIKPTQNNYSDVTDYVYNKIDLTEYWDGQTSPMDSTIITKSGTRIALVDKTERKITSDSGETVTRYGTGSFEQENPKRFPGYSSNLPFFQNLSGVYRNNNTELLVTRAREQVYDENSPNSGSGYINTTLDPFSKIDSRYLQTYAPDLRVPGGFTFSDGAVNIFTPIKIKVVPSNIYVFISYDASDPAFADGAGLKATQYVLNQIKALNPKVNIKYIITDSREKMFAAIKNVPSGAMLIVLGHGGPTGLVVGINDNNPEHWVRYSELSTALYKNNIKLDVFAGDSCYSARAPLADKVFGSIGVSSGGGGQSIGSLFGVGGHSFTATTNNILDALLKAFELGKSPISPLNPTAPPTAPAL